MNFLLSHFESTQTEANCLCLFDRLETIFLHLKLLMFSISLLSDCSLLTTLLSLLDEIDCGKICFESLIKYAHESIGVNDDCSNTNNIGQCSENQIFSDGLKLDNILLKL